MIRVIWGARFLRHPPEEAATLAIVYLLIALSSFATVEVHDPDLVDEAIAATAGFLGIVGGIVGGLAQFRALWFLERGALWAVWASLTVRSALVVATADIGVYETVALVSILAALCLIFVPRLRAIQGADQNPHV